MLLAALTISSVSLLVFSAHTIIIPVRQQPAIKCCQQVKENEPVSPWDIMSQAMFRMKA